MTENDMTKKERESQTNSDMSLPLKQQHQVRINFNIIFSYYSQA